MKTTTVKAVGHAAMLLMEANGTTTSLDVKNLLRSIGYYAVQDEISGMLQVAVSELNSVSELVSSEPLIVAETVYEPVPHQVYKQNPALENLSLFDDEEDEPTSADQIADLYRDAAPSDDDEEAEAAAFFDAVKELAEEILGGDAEGLVSAKVLKVGDDGETVAEYDLLSEEGMEALSNEIAGLFGAPEADDSDESEDNGGVTVSDALTDTAGPLTAALVLASVGEYTARDGSVVYIFATPDAITSNGGTVYRESYDLNGTHYFYAQSVSREHARGAHRSMTGLNYNDVRSRSYAA